VLDKPEQPKPVRLAALEPIARAKRAYGRGTGIVCGIVLIGSRFLPRIVVRGGTSGGPPFEYQGDWSWQSWGWASLPMMAGILGVAGGLLRSPARGICLFATGTGLLLYPPLAEYFEILPLEWSLLSNAPWPGPSVLEPIEVVTGVLAYFAVAVLLGAMAAFLHHPDPRRVVWRIAVPAVAALALTAWTAVSALLHGQNGPSRPSLQLFGQPEWVKLWGLEGAVRVAHGTAAGLTCAAALIALIDLRPRRRAAMWVALVTGAVGLGVLLVTCAVLESALLLGGGSRIAPGHEVGYFASYLRDLLHPAASCALIQAGCGSLGLRDPVRGSRNA
jgi:hypothetical protein